VLDGKAMTIPSRNIRGIESSHLFGFNDDILQNLVKGGTHVNMPVGIRGTVMEHIALPAFRRFSDDLIKILPVPLLTYFRFLLDQIGFHGKSSFGQIESFLKIH
jgi:hypothetical protein